MKTHGMGSMVNILTANTKSQEPTVGMGATECCYSDRHAYTVVELIRFKSGAKKGQVKEVVLQQDKATRTDKNGMSDSQTYTFEPNPNAERKTARLHKDGRFYLGSSIVRLGDRSEYYDFGF